MACQERRRRVGQDVIGKNDPLDFLRNGESGAVINPQRSVKTIYYGHHRVKVTPVKNLSQSSQS